MNDNCYNPFAATLQHSPFFRASCGCIGFYWGNIINHGAGLEVPSWSVVQACDSNPDEHMSLANGRRAFDPSHEYTPLTREETDALLTYLNRLVFDGYQCRKFASRLAWMVNPANRQEPPEL